MRLYTAFIPCLCAFRDSRAFDEEGWALYLNAVKSMLISWSRIIPTMKRAATG